MIRCIMMNGQVCEGDQEFSFWDTTVDKFITVGDSQMWDSKKDLLGSWLFDFDVPQEKLDRMIRLIPEEAAMPESNIDKLREARDTLQGVLDAAIYALDDVIFKMDESPGPVVPIVTSQPMDNLRTELAVIAENMDADEASGSKEA